MKATLACALLAAIVGLAGGCRTEAIRMREAPGSDRFVKREPIGPEDCRDEWRHLLVKAEPPLGFAEGRQQVAEGFVLSSRLRWNDFVRSLGGMFGILCAEHNEGLVTLQGYRSRLAQLRKAAALMEALRPELSEGLSSFVNAKDQLQKARAAADGEVAAEEARQRMADVRESVNELLEQVGRHLARLRGAPLEKGAAGGETTGD